METLRIEIAHEWRTVESAPGKIYRYPEEVTDAMRRALTGPAIYRWNIYESAPGDLQTVWVGETDNLPNRIYLYRNPKPGQEPYARTKVRLVDAMTSGRRVTLETLYFEPWSIGNATITRSDLSEQAVRKFLADTLMFALARSGYTVWNLQAAPSARDLLRF